MPRAVSVIPAALRREGQVVDTVILPFAQRQAARESTVAGLRGTQVVLDLPQPARLRTDDALVLDDGTLVEVVAQPEPLVEVRAPDLPALARLAWHLGDRHLPVQIFERRLRLLRDPATEDLLRSLGAQVTAIEAPFEPEGGAYEAHGHRHDHHHHHDHDGHGHHHHHVQHGHGKG